MGLRSIDGPSRGVVLYLALRPCCTHRALYSPCDAQDLTGAPAFSYRLDDDQVRKQIEDGTFWKKLMEWDEMGYAQCAACGHVCLEVSYEPAAGT